MKIFNKKFTRGFTIIELIIVVAIIVIVIGIAAASYSTIQVNNRNTRRLADLQQIASALEKYYFDYGTYPNTGSNFQSSGRSTDDVIRCLLGGTVAQNKTGSWPCSTPSNWKVNNVYLAAGQVEKIPVDPLYNDPFDLEASYGYASDGQSFVLVTRHYEGIAPIEYRFVDTNDYWDAAVNKSPWGHELTDNKNQYYVHSPTR